MLSELFFVLSDKWKDKDEVYVVKCWSAVFFPHHYVSAA